VVATGQTPAEYLAVPAYLIGLGIILAALAESTGNIRNLVRADWVAILALYGLTLAEFLFQQPEFNERSNMLEAERALRLFTLGFLSLVAGRHLFVGRTSTGFHISNLSPRLSLTVFWIIVPLAFAAELWAVKFNLFAMIDAQMGPRFSQPWSRGQLGGLYSLLYELGLFKYAIPALAGVLLNSWRRIGLFNLALVLFPTLLTLFFGFCGGTRNVFAAYLAGFVGTFLLTQPRLSFTRVATVGICAGVIFMSASYYMLEFRNIGFKRFVSAYDVVDTRDTFYVDYNMWAIGKLGLLFPARHQHIGLELYWHALTKPVPRAIWSGKPIDLTTSIEGALEVEGLTVSTTFIGESFMAFGEFGVVITGLFLGFVCGWWNYMGGRMRGGYGQLVYASGFAAIAIAMRSLMFFTTNMLPTIGLVVLGHWINQSVQSRNRK